MSILLLVLILLAMATAILGSLNAYQAITGRRVSRKPSVRTDEQVRRQSAGASVVLLGSTVLLAVMIEQIAAL